MTLNTDLMFSSKTGKWDTPADLADDLATAFDWDLDVCADRPNICENYFNEEENALLYDWSEWRLRWMNPPYGRNIKRWVKSAQSYYKTGATVCLVPARTDTRWWQDYIGFASQVVFIRGRLKFGEATNSAPFPSAFVVFGEISREQQEKLASYGWSVNPTVPF